MDDHADPPDDAEPPDPLVGRLLNDRYQVLARVGEGGMGYVYKARQEPIGRLVALKVLLQEVAENEQAVRRFLNEARIISQLRHPNTVSLIDFGHLEGTGQLFIAMEFLAGGQLRDLLDRGRIDPVAALRMTRQICQSLAEAHAKGIYHRDLKPENVLLDDVEGEQFVVKVVDFGIAKLNPALAGLEAGPLSIQLTAPGTRLGTPAYIPPEQAFGKAIDGRTDLYALGVLLYEMLTGHLPFKSDSEQGLFLEHLHTPPRPISEAAPDLAIDPAIERLTLQMLEKKPDDRPPSADAVIRTIDQILMRLAPPTEGPTPQGPVTLERARMVDAPTDDTPVTIQRSGPPGWFWAVLAVGLLAILAVAILR